jgi:eukaryotic-like serine/threonine-protein kinase
MFRQIMPTVSIGAGTRIGPYEVMSRLGAGGMGEVWKARDMRLERDVAVKVLPQAFATDVDRIRRFQQEARAVAALNHPNICQIHDVGPDYLVLEYVEGSPLCGPLPDADARRLALQVASALEAAHKRGLLHRDLKPANVLVTTDGRAKLLDFGIAKLVTTDEVTQTAEGAVVGTAPYMSPEQVQGKTLDGRSDIFSFGSVLYELLSGERAFAGESSADVLSAILRDTPRSLAASPLSRIASRCLEKDPSHRYQTMAEVRAALEDVTRARPEAEPSIAVLPFENLSADKDNEYFGDGLAEEIINALTRIPGLKVIARTSAFAFKGKHEDIRRIASALGVTTVLEGSVRKAGSRIRVTAQLITAADGSHLWSERYDRELADVFAVQDEIAAAITQALHVKLSPRRRHTPSLPAYEQYLKALFYAQRWTPDSLAVAKDCLEQAIALDPQFAVAHAELGHLFLRYAIYGLMPPRDALARVRAEARRALDMDPNLAEGHAMLGSVSAMFDFDWPEAERQFQLALADGASHPHVHRYYAHYCLVPLMRSREAIEHHTIAFRADPLNLSGRAERAVSLAAAGLQGEAEADMREVITLDPSFWFPYFIVGHWRAVEGHVDEALALVERGHQLAPWFLPLVAVLAVLMQQKGENERASALTGLLRFEEGQGDPIGPAVYHMQRGELDACADWVEKAIEHRQPAVFFFLHTTAKTLQSTPRWPKLAEMMKLPA